MGLLFSVRELMQENIALRELADSYLEPGGTAVLHDAERELENISRRSDGRLYPWGIDDYNPLRTKSSVGKYMRGAGGGLEVYGEITFIWELTPIGATRRQPAREVRLNGKASTRIRILEGRPNSGRDSEELAMWRMEVADDQSPGAYFHVQILGREDDIVFPHALDVPRLPNALISPFACVEFVLGELFQDDW